MTQGNNMLKSSQSQQKMFETASYTNYPKNFSKEKTTTESLKSLNKNIFIC